MSNLTIGNIEECEIIYGYQLPPDKRSDFDYLSDDDYECQSFIKYRNDYYSIDQFMKCGLNNPFGDFWHGYHSDSAFSGVLIHVSKCGDGVIAATYLS